MATDPSELSPVEAAKRLAARRAVDIHVGDGMIIGVGSGSTITYAIQRLSERRKDEGLNVVCIPSSFQSKELLTDAGMTLGELTSHPVIDVAIDGADEVDRELNLIKGGGGCHLQEKLLTYNAKLFVVIADYRKQSERLGTVWRKGVPLEVVPMAYAAVKIKVETALGGKAVLRRATQKAGPVVTDSGNLILDVDFGGITDPAGLHLKLIAIPGVVETGLFCGQARRAYFGMSDGSVEEWGKGE